MVKVEELYDFQLEIIDDAIKDVNKGKNPLICIPTGAGKTIIANHIIQKLKNKYEILFVAPRRILISQAIDEFTEKDDIDTIKKFEAIYPGIKIRCIPSAKRWARSMNESVSGLRGKKTKSGKEKPVLIIFDEAHQDIKGIWQVYTTFTNYGETRCIGLTATPERADGIGLVKRPNISQAYINTFYTQDYAVFDTFINPVGIPELTKKDLKRKSAPTHALLVKPRIFIKQVDFFKDPNLKWRGDELIDSSMRDYFKDKVYGDVITMYKEYGITKSGEQKTAIGFCPLCVIAEDIVELLNTTIHEQHLGTEKEFKYIDGSMGTKQRDELIRQLNAGEIAGLVCSDLLTTGFNCPRVEYIFSLKHVRSLPYFIQLVGRGLRYNPGKRDCVYVDHGDSISNFLDRSIDIFSEPRIDWKIYGDDGKCIRLKYTAADVNNMSDYEVVCKCLINGLIDPIDYSGITDFATAQFNRTLPNETKTYSIKQLRRILTTITPTAKRGGNGEQYMEEIDKAELLKILTNGERMSELDSKVKSQLEALTKAIEVYREADKKTIEQGNRINQATLNTMMGLMHNDTTAYLAGMSGLMRAVVTLLKEGDKTIDQMVAAGVIKTKAACLKDSIGDAIQNINFRFGNQITENGGVYSLTDKNFSLPEKLY